MPNKIRVNLRAASKKCAEVRHLMSEPAKCEEHHKDRSLVIEIAELRGRVVVKSG